jgi:hypothetical protein
MKRKVKMQTQTPQLEESSLKIDGRKRGRKDRTSSLLYFAQGIRALEMRRAGGFSWNEIAEALQFENPNLALKCARAAQKKEAEETAEELRATHHERYEFMYKSLIPKIATGRERAIEVAAQVLEKDAKLMGINADAEQSQGNFQPILIQIRPHPDDPEAIKLAKNAIIEHSKPKLLPAPDKSV